MAESPPAMPADAAAAAGAVEVGPVRRTHQFLKRGWRLAVPLTAIVAIVAIAGSLLFAAQAFERSRQEQSLISDALWAEQSVSYEVSRMVDGVRALGRPSFRGNVDEMRMRMRSVMQRDRAIVALHIWNPRSNELALSSHTPRPEEEARIREAGLRASRLDRPATLEAAAGSGDATQMLFAMPLEGGDEQAPAAVVAVVSLHRLLQNTIPWWLAHSTEITLEDTAGTVLARRDENVQGRGVYTHKIATGFVDRSLYLNANSSQGTPLLIPNLLTLSIASLSLLLAWTVYELWRDLGRRTRAESALRAQQALQTAMEHSLVTGLRARDMHGRITYANPAFCDMVGHTLEDIVRMRPPMPYWAPSAVAGAQARHEERLAGGSLHNRSFESRFVRPDGETLDVLMHEAPLLDGSGTQIGWMASVLDISEQKRNAELLRVQGERIQKMSRLMTMGEMASALAHELNQPLAAATSYITAGLNMVEDPQRSAADVQAAADYFAKARKQTKRAGEIIKRVRQFVGHSVPALTRLDVHEVLKDLLPLIRLQAGDAASAVVMRLEPHLPVVLADRVLLEQIILNLTKNAFEAMSALPPPHKRLEIFGERVPGAGAPRVRLGVRDHGPGLGEGSARVLSSTLTTTKPGGLGMGLAVCRKASELLGTTLEYQTAPGGGAQFHFTLEAVASDTG